MPRTPDLDRLRLLGAHHLLAPTPSPPPPPLVEALPPPRLAAVRLLLLDGDGVLTDGRLWVDPDGREQRCFHVFDGHGVSLLHALGLRVGLATLAPENATSARARKLRLDPLLLALTDKGQAVADLLAQESYAPHEVAFVGDDLPDLAAFDHVGLPIAPPNARPELLARAHATTRACGGAGAVREVCEALARAHLAALRSAPPR